MEDPLKSINNNSTLTNAIWENNRAGLTKLNEKEFIDYSNWDIFNLQKHIKNSRTLHQILEQEGVHIKSRRFASGVHKVQKRITDNFSKFIFREASVEFVNKRQSYFSLVSTLGQSGDLFVYDQEIDAPISESAYLVGAGSSSFSADSVESLENTLKDNSYYKRFFVLFESVSLESGKIRPYEELLNIAKKYKAEVFLDESFALGVLGIRGAGLLDHLKRVNDKVTIIADTSYVPNIPGCFISGTRDFINYLYKYSISLRNDFAQPPFLAFVKDEILSKLEFQTANRDKLLISTVELSDELKSLDLNVVQDIQLPFLVIHFENKDKMYEVRNFFREKSFLVEEYLDSYQSSFYIRVLINVEHTESQNKKLLKAFSLMKSKDII